MRNLSEMLIRSVVAMLLLLSSFPALCADVLTIDPSHTAVVFSWNHRGFSHPVARFEQVSGKVLLDRSDLSKSSVSVNLPVTGLRTGSDALDKRLKGAEFLDAAAYPAITFKSTKVEAVDASRLKITGNLSVHGVTQVVVLDVKVNKISVDSDGKVIGGFDADVALRRSDFGVGRYVPMTGDDLTVHITIEAGQE